MKQQIFSFPWLRSLAFPSAAASITLIIYLILSMGLAYFMLLNPLLGLIGALVINLIVLFFMWPRLALPFYILVAVPSISLSFIGSGILSRLYIGDLLFALVVGIWLLRTVLHKRKSGQIYLEPGFLAPFAGLILVGLTSIIYSRLFPDPNVQYSFVHSNVSITVVNITEMALLIGLPMFLVIVPGMVRTVRDVRWVLRSYMALGMLYALGTIFAAPLGLYSQEVILGNRRPEVFGVVSSGLGVLLVIFTCIAFGQALYSRKRVTRWCWSLLTCIFVIAVIMSFGREAWVGLFLSVLAMIGLRLKNWWVLLILLVLLLLLFIPGVTDYFDPGKVYGIDRLQIWQDAIAIWQHSPYIGIGAGNFQFFDLTYGIDVVGVAHNQYLEVLAEMGIPGLFCLLWILIAVGRLTLKRFNAASTSLSKALALAWIGYFVTIIVGGFFTDSFVQSAAGGGGTASFVGESYTWLLLGLVLSIPNWEKEAEQAEQGATQTNEKIALEAQQKADSVSEYVG